MHIDLPGIEAFISIANWRSFRRAAGHLNLSQAALSHRLKKLEENLGVPLLTRTTREVTLTPAGQELLPVAQRMLQEISSTLDGVRERAKTHGERLAVGCLPTLCIVRLPSILMRFRSMQPKTNVQIFDNSTGEIAERVRARTADFGVTIISVNSWDFEITPLMKDPFVLVCARSSPLARRASIQWGDLKDEALIRISEEAGNRVLIDEALGRRRETMTWSYEVQRVATAIGLVRAGVGLTVVPRMGLEAAGIAGVVGVPLRNPSVARTLGIIARRGDPLSAGAALLSRLITEDLRDSSVAAASQPTRSEPAAT